MSDVEKQPNIEIPAFLRGRIVRLEVDICMQKGVDHLLIHTTAQGIASTRLQAANQQVAEIFKKAEGMRVDLAIAGYWRFGVEGPHCNYISVYAAGPAEAVQSFLTAAMSK